MKHIPCKSCGKKFKTPNDQQQHFRAVHGTGPVSRKRLAHMERMAARAPTDDDPSIASLVIDASIRRACGEPIEDWIADMLE